MCKVVPNGIFRGESGFQWLQLGWMALDSHRQHAYAATTKTAERDIEWDQGVRYSILLDLPYFNPLRMCVIDPMHNLLLGTAEHMLSVWIDLARQHFDDIQCKVDSFTTPGRIPTKIAAGFSGFNGVIGHYYFPCLPSKTLFHINIITAGNYL